MILKKEVRLRNCEIKKMVKIRKAKKEDLKKIAEIYRIESAKKPYNQRWTKKSSLKKIEKAYSEENIYVSIENSKLVGFIILVYNKSNKKRVYLSQFWIKEKYQKRGIGKNLIKFLEREFKKKKIKIVDLIAHRNAEAVKFYNKVGFKDSKEFVFMTKKLK